MIKVISEITVYEIDRPKIQILSHWNRDEFVVIKGLDNSSITITVARKDLEAAIRNACNSARH